MSNIDEARAHLEEGLFDTDSSDDDAQSSSSSDDENDNETSKEHLKPALKKGDKIVAAYWDLGRNERMNTDNEFEWFGGRVHRVKEVDHYAGSYASEYGPVRIYDIHYDDGDKLEKVLDVYVQKEKDYELEHRNTGRKGVRNVKDKTSSDRYAKDVGWYVATIGGEERSFSSIYEAMKCADKYTIEVKKGDVSKSDLNLPNEWKLPKKKRGRPKKVDSEGENPKKKSKKVDMKEIFDDSDNDSDNGMEDVNVSVAHDQEDSKMGATEETNYVGVSTNGSRYNFRGYFKHESKYMFAGNYLLKADAAHARDECCRELGISDRGFNFNTTEEYNNARVRERKKRGLSLEKVGTLSDVASQIEERKNKIMQTNNNDKGESEEESEEESVASEQDRAEFHIASKLSADSEKSKYTGVYYITLTSKYRGVAQYKKKTVAAGEFTVAADAAHARDEFCRTMKITRKGFNFSSEKEYKDARAEEIERRGLSVDEVKTFTVMLADIQARKATWIDRWLSNNDEDDSSQSSSDDDMPLIAMKSKGRHSTSQMETVTKAISNYRGVESNQRKEKQWTVSVIYNGEDTSVGNYDLESDAARVYDEVTAILSSNDDPNFATKSDYEQARKREAKKLGLDLATIDSFEASMEKAQIYLNRLLSEAGNVDGETRKRRSTSPFTPISPVENVNGSSRKIANLNEAMTMKWGRRLPPAGSIFLDSYQHSICDLLGGVAGEDINEASIERLVSTSTVQSTDYQDEGMATDFPRNINMPPSTDDQVQNVVDEYVFMEDGGPIDAADHESQDEGMGEKKHSIEGQRELVVDGHGDSKDKDTVEKKNSVEEETVLNVASQDNQEADMTEEVNPIQDQGVANVASHDSQATERKYVGVTKLKASGRYRGQLQFRGKSKSTGDFLLETDAAHARDVFCCSFGLNKPLNFLTVDAYEQARAKEIEERRLTLDAADTNAKKKDVASLAGVAARIQAKKAKWDAESRTTNSDSPTSQEKQGQSKQTAQDDSDDNVSLFSDSGDKEENVAPSKASSVATLAASNVTAAKTTPKLSEMTLVALTKEQEEQSLEFPVGCHVVWKLQDESFERGVVSSGFFGIGSQSVVIVYEVKPLNGQPKEKKCAPELAFDTNCPVYIKTSPADNSSLVEGEVLLSRIDSMQTLYTILLKKEGGQCQLQHDVPSDLVSARKITKPNESPSKSVANDSNAGNEESHSRRSDSKADNEESHSRHSEQNSHTKSGSAKEAATKRLSSPGGKEVNGHCDMSISTSGSTISTRDSGRLSTPRGRIGNGNATQWDECSIEIELPDWFVSDNAVKDHLGYHLVGSPRGKKNIFTQIYDKTGCTLTMPKNMGNVIRIEAKAGKFSIDSLRKAKIELENVFLDYLDRDGCIGRLFYDLASSCHNLHPQRGKTCVYQRNPWEPNEMGYMSVVEIPYIGNNWDKPHHNHIFSKKLKVLSRVRSTGCTVTIVDKHGRVRANWVACKPYVWVWGLRPGDVDDAVKILNDANSKHMDTCNCHLP